jgi:CDP-4-dehydro-6-deoxyglucose reductase, E1
MERSHILTSAREYFNAQPVKEFVAGETYIPVTSKTMDASDLEALIDSSLDMWLTTGRYGREFEATLPKHFDRKVGALLVNSGSSANLVAISALGSPKAKEFKREPLKPGDEVITLAAGFPTTVNPIVQNGWKPVFIDIDLKTLNGLPEKIFEAKTSKTKAVILAHTLGNPFRSDLVSEWCKKEGIYLVEDCCDALGATVADRPVGSYGDFATLSFYPAHHITTGEGGAVISADGKWKLIAESIRDWGRDCWCEPGVDNTCKKRFEWQLGGLPCGYDHKYTYSHIGYNLKVTDMQAALGVSQLKKLPAFVEARRRNWKALYDGVKGSPILSKYLTPVEPTANTNPSWFGFPMHAADSIDRDKLTRNLEAKKIGTRLLFAGNLTKQPAYSGVDYRIHGSLENTDRVMTKTFWLGVHPGLTPAMIAYMLETLEKEIKSLAE